MTFKKCVQKYLICTGFIFNIILAILALTFIDSCLQPKSDRYKFTAVDYKDGQLIFYLAEDIKFMKAPYYAIDGFNVVDTSLEYGTPRDSWAFITKIAEMDKLDCGKAERRSQFSKIIYGKTPDCYKDMVAVKELKKNVMYHLDRCVTPFSKNGKKQKYVEFMLKDCPDNPEETCLETNSPAPDDIEEKHKIMLERLKNKKLRMSQ